MWSPAARCLWVRQPSGRLTVLVGIGLIVPLFRQYAAKSTPLQPGSSEGPLERDKRAASFRNVCMWRTAEKKQEEHRALTPADLSSQPEGCELRVRLVSQPQQPAVRNGQLLGGRGLLNTRTLGLQPQHECESTKRSDGTRGLASVADLGGYNADRSWSTCNSTVSLRVQTQICCTLSSHHRTHGFLVKISPALQTWTGEGCTTIIVALTPSETLSSANCHS